MKYILLVTGSSSSKVAYGPFASKEEVLAYLARVAAVDAAYEIVWLHVVADWMKEPE